MILFVWRRSHFCAIKSTKVFIILVSYCSRMQFCIIKFMINTDTCSAWFVIALIPIVGYSLNEMINL